MLSDLDRYYTPEHVARYALERVALTRAPLVCADSTCGTGRLLEAASDIFGRVRCVGIDRDIEAIEDLRRRNPEWLLAVGDLLNRDGHLRKFSRTIPSDVDLLVLNPPFSQGNKKSVDITYEGLNIKGSVAMAHLLRSFELFKPTQGAMLIAPESLLYSELDSAARAVLSDSYSIRKVADLESATFRGARAHACVVQIAPSMQGAVTEPCIHSGKVLRIKVTRGGLPVHVMIEASHGVPFVHSTDIRNIVSGAPPSTFSHTANQLKGRIDGWVLLMPRVGLPDKSLIKAIKIDSPIQLSDCVIALECPNKTVANQVSRRIQDSWSSFLELYKGTGARYITLSRLRDWLTNRNIQHISDQTVPHPLQS